jgi:hypothetical protein
MGWGGMRWDGMGWGGIGWYRMGDEIVIALGGLTHTLARRFARDPSCVIVRECQDLVEPPQWPVEEARRAEDTRTTRRRDSLTQPTVGRADTDVAAHGGRERREPSDGAVRAGAVRAGKCGACKCGACGCGAGGRGAGGCSACKRGACGRGVWQRVRSVGGRTYVCRDQEDANGRTLSCAAGASSAPCRPPLQTGHA